MRHFGTIVFGAMAAVAALAVLWLSHGAGSKDPGATVFGIAISPVLYLIFAGPFALLFFVSLARSFRR